MNLLTKHILAASAIAGVAGAIGYLIGHRRGRVKECVEEHQEEKMVEAPRSVKAILGVDRMPESLYNKHFKKDDVEPIHEGGTSYNLSELEPVIGKNGGWGLKTKTTDKLVWNDAYINEMAKKISQDYISDDIEEDTDDEEEVKSIRAQGDVEYTSDEPYLVSDEEVFNSETNPCDIDELTYYQDDKVLADAFDEIVENKELVCGSIYPSILDGAAPGTVLYIRNPITKRDYSIIIVDDAYEKVVLGADDDQYLNAVKYFNLGDD